MKITLFRIKKAYNCVKNGNGVRNALYFFDKSYNFNGL